MELRRSNGAQPALELRRGCNGAQSGLQWSRRGCSEARQRVVKISSGLQWSRRSCSEARRSCSGACRRVVETSLRLQWSAGGAADASMEAAALSSGDEQWSGWALGWRDDGVNSA
ncbi:hypothetical protein VPH35_016654 [Triticum aestivum]